MDKTHLDPARTSPTRKPSQGAKPVSDAARRGDEPPPSDQALLRALGEYRILRRLGEGGMGAVYLAYHGREDRQVALKVLNDALSSSQDYVDRFYREARSGSQLNHPNIVRTLGVGQDRATGMHYLVLEYVDGPSAQALLDHYGILSVGDAVHVALDVARALEHAHARSIVHRDIKPDNVLLTRSGVAKLGDLGLAKRTDEPSHLTAARQGFGTTAYMPYEQAINAKYADGRSDLYALGATLYHLVTGSVPFPAENHLEVVEKKNRGYFIPAAALNPAVPDVLDQILARMLARQPGERYQTASELIIDLERSGLAAPVPSFADPELARRDPWVQACLNSSEPTRLDLGATPASAPGSAVGADDPPEEVWLLRSSGRDGLPRTVRATSRQIRARLASGVLTSAAEVRRPDQGQFQPLESVPEFRDALPVVAPPPTEHVRPAPAEEEEFELIEPSCPMGLRPLVLMLGVGAFLVLGTLLVLARWWRHA